MKGGLLMLFIGIFLTTNVLIMEASLGEASTNSAVIEKKTLIRVPEVFKTDVPKLKVHIHMI